MTLLEFFVALILLHFVFGLPWTWTLGIIFFAPAIYQWMGGNLES